MNVIEVEERTEQLVRRLMEVWRESVEETHLFLSDAQIDRIAPFVPVALRTVSTLVIAVGDKHSCPCAFMGIENGKLEMLFVSPAERGKGVGKRLLLYGIEKFSVRELCVNEQNPHAVAFYSHLGFVVVGRSDTDEQGNPYPILHMVLSEPARAVHNGCEEG